MDTVYLINIFNPLFEPHFIYLFCTYGIAANIAIGLFAKFLVINKYVTLNEDEKQIYLNFHKSRGEYIKHHNSVQKLILNFFSFLIPTYTAWLYTVFIWNYMRDKSVYGICKGIMWFDKFSFFQIAKYKKTDK